MKLWLVFRSRISRIEFSQCCLRNSLQHFLGEDSQKLPANVQGLVNSAVFVRTCRKQPQTATRSRKASHYPAELRTGCSIGVNTRCDVPATDTYPEQ